MVRPADSLLSRLVSLRVVETLGDNRESFQYDSYADQIEGETYMVSIHRAHGVPAEDQLINRVISYIYESIECTRSSHA